VPDPILDRRDKIGFQTPEAQWLVGSTAFRDKLSSMIPERQAPCFSPTFHARARQMIASRAHDPAIWRGLCLSRWSELSDVEIAA
jgi:asparagine synthase (glutamine-hydrolysing)